MNTVTVGQQVTHNGFDAIVVEVCNGQLEGMCVVRLASGSACTSISELLRFNQKQ